MHGLCSSTLCAEIAFGSRHGSHRVLGFSPVSLCVACACESDDSYLVDPASSHMLVSKIKPCMSKYKHLYCETANGSLNQLSFI